MVVTSGVEGSGNTQKRRSSITVSPELHDAIAQLGAKPDTFETILWRAVAALKKEADMQQQGPQQDNH
jgi:hypothetical protein